MIDAPARQMQLRSAAPLFIAAGLQTGAAGETRPDVGSEAPEFELPQLQGGRVRLSEFRGRTVLLNFWAFWCDTWKAELPDLRELAKQQDALHFQIVSVSVDGTRVAEFRQASPEGAPFPALLDVGGNVTARYRVENVPTVIVIDPQGIVRYRCIAWPGSQTVLNQLRKLAPARPGPKQAVIAVGKTMGGSAVSVGRSQSPKRRRRRVTGAGHRTVALLGRVPRRAYGEESVSL